MLPMKYLNSRRCFRIGSGFGVWGILIVFTAYVYYIRLHRINSCHDFVFNIIQLVLSEMEFRNTMSRTKRRYIPDKCSLPSLIQLLVLGNTSVTYVVVSWCHSKCCHVSRGKMVLF